METENTYKATILTNASKTMSKSNGGSYVLHNAKITSEGPLKGFVVAGTRTMKNASGDVKKGVSVGDEITLHLTVVTNAEGSKKPFFEIATGTMSTADADIISALGMQNI